MKQSPRAAILALVLALVAASAAAADDRAAILSLLKKHSPDGFYILDSYAKSGGTDFMEYWDPSSDDSRLHSYNTIVHEIAHGVMAEMADRDSILFLANRDERIMVPLTEVFYSREMVSSFPEELRTFRFDYIDCGEDNLGAQAHGAYGLLDEMNAYFLGTKTSWDLLPYFEAQGKDAPWGSFFQAINGTLYGILEFKLYVLKYLMFARERKPEVYKKIMANRKFAEAFLAVDRASSGFIQDYFARKELVYESLRKQGLKVKEEGGYLMIGSGGQCSGTFMDVYALLSEELEKKDYQDLMRRLNGGAAVAASPPAAAGAGVPSADEGAGAVATVTSHSITTGGSAGQSAAAAAPASAASPATSAHAGGWGSAAQPAAHAGGWGPAAQPPAASASIQDDQRESALGAIDRIGGEAGSEATLSWSGEDEVGDVGVDFIDISRADARLYPDRLVLGISFAAFPGKLMFNNPNLEENSLEYEWSCDIDLEGDGKPDYSISMCSFKAPGAKPVEASVTLFCQTDLWKLSTSGGSLVEGRVRAETDGSALFLSLADGAALPLRKITARTAFTLGTRYANGKSVAGDSLGL